MSRPKRINLPGCVYHVICRANRHDVIFEDDEDKERFLEYLTDYLEQFEMRIHAYCNHENRIYQNASKNRDLQESDEAQKEKH